VSVEGAAMRRLEKSGGGVAPGANAIAPLILALSVSMTLTSMSPSPTVSG
jgi:hypothetical protein